MKRYAFFLIICLYDLAGTHLIAFIDYTDPTLNNRENHPFHCIARHLTESVPLTISVPTPSMRDLVFFYQTLHDHHIRNPTLPLSPYSSLYLHPRTYLLFYFGRQQSRTLTCRIDIINCDINRVTNPQFFVSFPQLVDFYNEGLNITDPHWSYQALWSIIFPELITATQMPAGGFPQ